MGLRDYFDRSPEAVAAGLATMREGFAAEIGQPITACLAGLSPPGALGQVVMGVHVSRNDHKATGGATDRTHHGLLAVTADGALRSYRTKARRGRFRIVSEVRVWPAGTARVRIVRQTWTVVIAVDDLAFELLADEAVLTQGVLPFAAAVGVVVEEV